MGCINIEDDNQCSLYDYFRQIPVHYNETEKLTLKTKKGKPICIKRKRKKCGYFYEKKK